MLKTEMNQKKIFVSLLMCMEGTKKETLLNVCLEYQSNLVHIHQPNHFSFSFSTSTDSVAKKT